MACTVFKDAHDPSGTSNLARRSRSVAKITSSRAHRRLSFYLSQCRDADAGRAIHRWLFCGLKARLCVELLWEYVS